MENVFTPSSQGLLETTGLRCPESGLDTKAGDIILMIGSMLDESEMAYRKLTNTVGHYVLVTDLPKEEISKDFLGKVDEVLSPQPAKERFCL